MFGKSVLIFSAKYLFLLAFILVIIYFVKLTSVKKKELFIFALLSLPVIFAISKIAALFYYDPRPYVLEHFQPLVTHIPDNGFPSDHVLLVSAIASIFFPFSKRFSLSIWLIAITVGVSRVLVGIHHPIDIIGSMIIAIFVSTMVFSLVKTFKMK